MIGASIKVVGTNTGTVTDVDGNFSLNVPADAKLEITYIGMNRQTVKASPKMNIVLTSDSKNLEEVVVTGYGVTRKAAFTGAATTLNKDLVEARNDANPIKSLEGTVPGLQLSTTSG